MDPFLVTLISSLAVAVVLLGMRLFVMQRVQQRRQRENRQETERLKSLVAAYRSLAGSFTPALEDQSMQLEETLSDIVLFGSLRQVELAAHCAIQLKRGERVDYEDLIRDLRSDLRRQLGLDPIPSSIELPNSGPGRSSRGGKGDGEGGGRGEGRGGGGGSGGGGAGGGMAMGVGGLGVGMSAADGS
jgi:uncharacterized membrane protein YgcG